MFGYVGGGPLPFELKSPGDEFVLAFQALPIVLVMSVLTTLLFYWRILPPIVRGFAWALERTLGVGGAVGLSTAANIFLGMVEAPLFIRPYLAQLSRGELFVVMTGGMAGIAGTVLVLYATILRDHPRCRRPPPDRLGARRAGRAADQPDHGAGQAGRAHRYRRVESSRWPISTMDAIVQGHRSRPRAAAEHRRHADRARRAGASRQCHARSTAGRWRRADHVAAHARHRHGAGVLADGHSVACRRRPPAR